MNPLTTIAAILTDAADCAETRQQLDAVTAERNAALQRVAVLEEELQRATVRGNFYFDMVTANDAWQRARRARAQRDGVTE